MTTEQKEWRISVLERLIAEDRIMGQRLTITRKDDEWYIRSSDILALDFSRLFQLTDTLDINMIVLSMNEVNIY